ncbi:hypothetical protein [Streptomyces sp. NPDC005374]|uniref:hypothetical protein n=1 Tax=Streptomyces sp. NPDC005374 TaxID=3364713 RepID=UPI0036AB122C
MASSDQPSDRDDDSPPRGTPEPDRGDAPRRRRTRVVGECLYWLIRLMLDLYDNGG